MALLVRFHNNVPKPPFLERLRISWMDFWNNIFQVHGRQNLTYASTLAVAYASGQNASKRLGDKFPVAVQHMREHALGGKFLGGIVGGTKPMDGRRHPDNPSAECGILQAQRAFPADPSKTQQAQVQLWVAIDQFHSDGGR